MERNTNETWMAQARRAHVPATFPRPDLRVVRQFIYLWGQFEGLLVC